MTTTAPPSSAVRSSGRGHDKSVGSVVFLLALWLSLALAITFLLTLLITTAIDGAGRFDSELITEYSSILAPETIGLRAALLGTMWLMVTTALLAIPIGIAAAVYLEEFADSRKWYNRLVELNLQNLAAVPSIIYGMLAVALFALVGVQRTGIVLVGAVALGLLILPVIIITTREAVRAVPTEIRDGSLALGATPLQTTWRQVLPSAIPGIATGTIIALSRAIGEAAPLLIIGVAVTVRFDPNGIMSVFTAMPIQIFNWTSESREEFKVAAAAAIIVLLVMVLALNGLAIYIRNKFQRSW
ncbi:MAG TPA: phosphate ABC transporter permease PstA [Nocardioidaceae bacterium]|jgi:phosphate transport system permease protein|nr:phosphate ABC transporter permease PstA [Nocardioidaceae bacterium]